MTSGKTRQRLAKEPWRRLYGTKRWKDTRSRTSSVSAASANAAATTEASTSTTSSPSNTAAPPTTPTTSRSSAGHVTAQPTMTAASFLRLGHPPFARRTFPSPSRKGRERSRRSCMNIGLVRMVGCGLGTGVAGRSSSTASRGRALKSRRRIAMINRCVSQTPRRVQAQPQCSTGRMKNEKLAYKSSVTCAGKPPPRSCAARKPRLHATSL